VQRLMTPAVVNPQNFEIGTRQSQTFAKPAVKLVRYIVNIVH